MILPERKFEGIPEDINWNIASVGVVHKKSIFAEGSAEWEKGEKEGLKTGGEEFGYL